MNFPDACPNCGANSKSHQERIDVRVYTCGTWIIENAYSKGPGTQKSGTCDDWRTIREATSIIREMLDEWGNAMDSSMLEKAEGWLKHNTHEHTTERHS